MHEIYLDNNATAPMLPEVADAMHEAHLRQFANPASQHGPGRQARRVLEEAREAIGDMLGAKTGSTDADIVVFTSGGTESNNLAIRGIGVTSEYSGDQRVVVISAIEHPSVTAAAMHCEKYGERVVKLPVDSSGVVQLDAVTSHLNDATRLASVMMGNNETGALQPVQRIADLCRQAGVLCHTDAVQAVGKIPIHFRDMNIDALTCTAHKLHGPPGIGALIIRHGTPIAPQLVGGFQQYGLRPGTESVALGVGFRTALDIWHGEQEQRHQRLSSLRDRFEQLLRSAIGEVEIVAQPAPRLPHVSNIAFVGFERQALQMALDMQGLACSTGSACASGSSELSPVLLAMGCKDAVISGSLRFSLGVTTSESDIDEAVRRISLVCNNLRR